MVQWISENANCGSGDSIFSERWLSDKWKLTMVPRKVSASVDSVRAESTETLPQVGYTKRVHIDFACFLYVHTWGTPNGVVSQWIRRAPNPLKHQKQNPEKIFMSAYTFAVSSGPKRAKPQNFGGLCKGQRWRTKMFSSELNTRNWNCCRSRTCWSRTCARNCYKIVKLLVKLCNRVTSEFVKSFHSLIVSFRRYDYQRNDFVNSNCEIQLSALSDSWHINCEIFAKISKFQFLNLWNLARFWNLSESSFHQMILTQWLIKYVKLYVKCDSPCRSVLFWDPQSACEMCRIVDASSHSKSSSTTYNSDFLGSSTDSCARSLCGFHHRAHGRRRCPFRQWGFDVQVRKIKIPHVPRILLAWVVWTVEWHWHGS